MSFLVVLLSYNYESNQAPGQCSFLIYLLQILIHFYQKHYYNPQNCCFWWMVLLCSDFFPLKNFWIILGATCRYFRKRVCKFVNYCLLCCINFSWSFRIAIFIFLCSLPLIWLFFSNTSLIEILMFIFGIYYFQLFFLCSLINFLCSARDFFLANKIVGRFTILKLPIYRFSSILRYSQIDTQPGFRKEFPNLYHMYCIILSKLKPFIQIAHQLLTLNIFNIWW